MQKQIGKWGETWDKWEQRFAKLDHNLSKAGPTSRDNEDAGE
jgi:hypothetical protein